MLIQAISPQLLNDLILTRILYLAMASPVQIHAWLLGKGVSVTLEEVAAAFKELAEDKHLIELDKNEDLPLPSVTLYYVLTSDGTRIARCSSRRERVERATGANEVKNC